MYMQGVAAGRRYIMKRIPGERRVVSNPLLLTLSRLGLSVGPSQVECQLTRTGQTATRVWKRDSAIVRSPRSATSPEAVAGLRRVFRYLSGGVAFNVKAWATLSKKIALKDVARGLQEAFGVDR
jgi:hypothetical protein